MLCLHTFVRIVDPLEHLNERGNDKRLFPVRESGFPTRNKSVNGGMGKTAAQSEYRSLGLLCSGLEQAVGIAPSGEEPWNPRGSVKGEEQAFRLWQGEFEELVRHSRRDAKGVQCDIKKLRFKREI